jgi:TonB family protein
MAAPDHSKPILSATEVLRSAHELGFEADFADLAARFAAKSGGGLSPELSAELALEIVLNEIVEQACQITGATGAAIVIDRDGELVCRASSGSTAPELGSRIDKSAGLAGEGLRTRKTLWCDDTFTDSRAEADPLKQFGIRSVVIMPLLRGDALVGVFELFSTQPYAFGVRDERTLEILADRTITNLDHVSQPFDAQTEPVGPAADLQEEDLQKIGYQDVALPKIGLHRLDGDLKSADAAEFAATNFGLPDFALQNPSRGEVSNREKLEVDSSSYIGAPDFAFPDVDLGEMSAEDIQVLLENAGVIAPEPKQVAKDVARDENATRQNQPEPRPQTQPEPEARVEAQFQPVIGPPALPKQVDYLSWALGFAIVSVAVLLGLVLGQHFVLSHSQLAARSALANQTPSPVRKSPDPAQVAGSAALKAASVKSASTTKEKGKSESTTKSEGPAREPSTHDRSRSSDESVPPGGLLVLENGKEVFRLPPSRNEDAASAQQVMQPASELQADSGSEQVLEIPEATAERELLHRVEPEYPEAARQQNIEGRVILELHIGPDGLVQDVETVSGSPILAQASSNAVKQWKFKPRMVDGRPREMQTRVTFDFKLPQ